MSVTLCFSGYLQGSLGIKQPSWIRDKHESLNLLNILYICLLWFYFFFTIAIVIMTSCERNEKVLFYLVLHSSAFYKDVILCSRQLPPSVSRAIEIKSFRAYIA